MKRTFFTYTLIVALTLSALPLSSHAQSGDDVYLVSPESVFSRVQIPSGFDSGIGYYPFNRIQWLSGGNFVVSGDGNSNAAVDQYPQAAGKIRESGGMYLIRESDGKFLGARDVVFDSSARVNRLCFEGGGCTAGLNVHLLGPNRFVRDLHFDGSLGIPRGPITYDATGSGFNLVNRLWFNKDLNAPPRQVGDILDLDDVAVAGGKIILTSLRQTGNNQHGWATEVYDLNFNRLASFTDGAPTVGSGQQPSTIEPFNPIVGVGDYFIASNNLGSFAATGKYKVYKMPSTDELINGVRPKEQYTIDTGALNKSYMEGWSFDAQNPNRIAVVWHINPFAQSSAPIPGAPTQIHRLIIYEASNAGLVPVIERDIAPPSGNDFTLSDLFSQSFSVSGDYIAYGIRPKGVSARGGVGELVVGRISSGELLSVEPIPNAKFPHPGESVSTQNPTSISISATGRVLVGAFGGLDNGNLYLYQIGELDGTGGGDEEPPVGDDTTPAGGDTPTFGDFEDVTRFYMDFLRKVYGFPTIFTDTNTGNDPTVQSRSSSQPSSSVRPVPSSSVGTRTGFLEKLFGILGVGR